MLGESAGRSAGNPTGRGARRKNTPRERSQIDPPFDERDQLIVEQARRIRTLRLILFAVAGGFWGYILTDLLF